LLLNIVVAGFLGTLLIHSILMILGKSDANQVQTPETKENFGKYENWEQTSECRVIPLL